MQWVLASTTLAGFLGLVCLVVRLAPRLAVDVCGSDSGAGGRHTVLDGFRGLLAIAVVLHHGVLARLLVSGASPAQMSTFDRFLGRGAVSFFFMTSAFLFAGAVLRADGRLDLRRFFVGRVRRILPLYAFAVAGAAALAIWEAGGRVREPAALLAGIGQWFLFDFIERPDLNGVAGSATYLGVVWTLRYEWLLYAALPVLALAYRKTGQAAMLYGGLALLVLPVHLFALFLAGAVACPLARREARHADAVLAIAAAAGVGLALTLDDCATARAAPLLFPAFLLVVRGRSPLVTWLGAMPLRYLGQLSYGLYLLHPLVLTVVREHGGPARHLLTGDPALFTLLMQGVFLVLLALATATYMAIERPFLRPRATRARTTVPVLVLRPT